jgi:hypothetical protein
MSLADELPLITRLDQLPALAGLLGLEPTWHEVALGSIGLEGRAGRAALVGRRESFVCLAVETEGAAPIREVTRALAARGSTGLVLALDRSARTLAVGVAAGDCPTLAVALDRLSRIDQRKLERGAAGQGSGIALALRWIEALSARGLGTRFFAQFRRTLDRVVAALPGRIPRRDRHGLALLQLTRVLFLYFVQEKGWLDGRPRFLREELDRRLGGRGRVHRRLLVPLFFGTLNRPPAARRRAARELGRIPFLNGGLFEPHPLERRWPVELPDPVWRDAFDELFERYHFTLADRADESAIGPDMLGRVFEGVMDPDERRDTGSFYTPRRLVDRIVGATLDAWARGAAVERGTAAFARAVRSITVLDPAVGSGAFLLGALDRLVGFRVEGGEAAAAATRSVVTTNLFGVDRNPTAVRLAELRLWLRVIEASPAERPDRVEPLPNLDAFVRQGDSLIEPFVSPGGATPALRAEVARARRGLATAAGPAKRERIRALRAAELAASKAELDRALAALEHRLRDLLDASRTRGLFGERRGLAPRERLLLERLRTERARLRRLARRLREEQELPWFHYGSQFAEVIGEGGFDLVVGNPPWVRAEALAAEDRTALKERYRWFRTGRAAGGYGHQPDLAVAFLERAVELTRPEGAIGFLLPAKLVTAQYGAAAREALARETTLEVAADLTESAAGEFDATVYPLALVARRAAPAPDHRLATDLGAPPWLPQRSLGSGAWSLRESGPPAGPAHPRLGDRFRCRLGVKTGADRVFLDPPVEGLEPHLRPALRGRDVGPFRVTPVRRILWTHDERGDPLPEPPAPAAAWLARHRAVLDGRADRQGPRSWQLFRTRAAVAPHRVVWADLARTLAATPLVGPLRPAIALNTCYLIVTPTETAALGLAAWLNAGPIRRLARARATPAASGFVRFNAATVEALPLPVGAPEDPVLVRLARAALDGAPVQEEIDRRAEELLATPAPGGPRC